MAVKPFTSKLSSLDKRKAFSSLKAYSLHQAPSERGAFRGFITTLRKELNASELLRCFDLVGALHQNFYENWLTAEMMSDYAEAIKSLVEKLKRLAR
ncbi:MAG: hypothetical protein KAW00_07350 [Dehalococcoidia bacterium]|nr:hypothetical protein [Dehalococcoidia bacterium]MCK4388574.1 hypothetical protein [Dehalococcoidia bacterium]